MKPGLLYLVFFARVELWVTGLDRPGRVRVGLDRPPWDSKWIPW